MQSAVMAMTMRASVELVAVRPSEISAARQTFARHLAAWGCTDCADAVVVFSELVTNAVACAGGATRIVVILDGSTVSLAVHDADHTALDERTGASHLSAHELSLVEQLSIRWAWEASSAGKVIWAKSPCSA